MHYLKKTNLAETAACSTYYAVNQSAFELTRNPFLNKGSAFDEKERQEFNLLGVLPPGISNLTTQRARSYKVFQSKHSDLEKYIYLRELQDSNETLFYSLVSEHLTEMMPIVYTPTVGAGCQSYSHIYRRPRGLYLAYTYKDQLDAIFSHSYFDAIEVIVVSDGERILGLGDQGVGGMGIPVGKLALYSVCAGIEPNATLPILLDTGTNNPDLFNDPLYLGWRHERIRGKEYADFIEAFVNAVKKRWPHILLQWEDFAQQNANPILAKYRDQLCTFNDDIQGTAAVATGTLLAAVQASKTRLSDQRIVIAGAGSAGCGISDLICQAMIDEGLPEAEARSRFYLIDSKGLLQEDNPELYSFQKPFACKKSVTHTWLLEHSGAEAIALLDVIKNVKPTVLIGVSGKAGVFNEAVIRAMAATTECPIIFPLSNPTSKAEATPEDLLKWTNGKAIIGTGSPFPPVMVQGQLKRIDQTNNAYIFPGMGLGIISVKSRRITDKMFMAAAKALAAASPSLKNRDANLLPPLDQIREVSYQVALATAKAAIAERLCEPYSDEILEAAIKAKMWTAAYVPYVRAKQED